MTVVHAADDVCQDDARSSLEPPARRSSPPIRIGLLGLGQVGAAVARRALASERPGRVVEISGALVRDPHRQRGLIALR